MVKTNSSTCILKYLSFFTSFQIKTEFKKHTNNKKTLVIIGQTDLPYDQVQPSCSETQ
jgi:hypothetical protein